MLDHVGKQSGQSVIGIFLGLSILFGTGVAALQLRDGRLQLQPKLRAFIDAAASR